MEVGSAWAFDLLTKGVEGICLPLLPDPFAIEKPINQSRPVILKVGRTERPRTPGFNSINRMSLAGHLTSALHYERP